MLSCFRKFLFLAKCILKSVVKKIILLHLWAKPRSSYIFFARRFFSTESDQGHGKIAKTSMTSSIFFSRARLALSFLAVGTLGRESWVGMIRSSVFLNLKIFIPGCRFFLEFFQDPLHSHCPPLKHEAIFLLFFLERGWF